MTIEVLRRRGFELGSITLENNVENQDPVTNWQQGKPLLLTGMCLNALDEYRHYLGDAEKLYVAILDQQECDVLFSEAPYHDRLAPSFEPLGCSVNEGDSQEIETAFFDAVNGDALVAQDLWVKVSWLSFYEHDASLRFRFSFGVDHIEDVAADQLRQNYAAHLAEAIFPESRIVTQNQALIDKLQEILACIEIKFVERIIYFNSPQGGAYLHHDRERGHDGVVYAQLSGMTFWLALPKQSLVDEIIAFVSCCTDQDTWPATLDAAMQKELVNLANDKQALAAQLDSFANTTLIHLINESKAFVQQLINAGHARVVRAGDAMLLPQQSDHKCCWHSVFNLGNEAGQALSFAIRTR